MFVSRLGLVDPVLPLFGVEDPLTRRLDALYDAVHVFCAAVRTIPQQGAHNLTHAQQACSTLNDHLERLVHSPRPTAQIKAYYRVLGELFEGEPGVVSLKRALFRAMGRHEVARCQSLVRRMLNQDLALLHASISALPAPGGRPTTMVSRYGERLSALRRCCVDAAQQHWASLLWASLAAPQDAPQMPRAALSSVQPLGGGSPPLVQVAVGIKVSRPRDVRDVLSGPELSVLVGTRGNAYLMGRTVAEGGAGKVRFARALSGELFAVKEVRERMGLPSPIDGLTRHVTQLGEILTETSQLREARGVIDGAFLRLEEENHPWSHPLRRVRGAPTVFCVQDLIRVPAKSKIYLPMTCLAGDLSELCEELDGPFATRATVLIVAAQIFAELSFLHEGAGYIHFDIKLENMGLHPSGQVVLIDFGLAQRLRNTPAMTYCGVRGSVVVPEMCPPSADFKPLPQLTQAVDIFALAVSLFEMASSRYGARNPFATNEQTYCERTGALSLQSMTLFERYAAWRAARTSALDPTRLDLNAIALAASKQDRSDTESSAPTEDAFVVFDAFFAPLINECPDLSALLLNHALRPEPSERHTARAFTDALMPWVAHLTRAELQAFEGGVAMQVKRYPWDQFAPAPRQHLVSALRAAACEASGGGELPLRRALGTQPPGPVV